MPRKKFSWKRATGISKLKYRIAKKTGIPTTKSGRKRKIKKLASGGGCGCVYTIAGIIVLISFLIFIIMIKGCC